MKQPRKFYDSLRSGILGPTLDNSEVSGCSAILEAMSGLPIAWAAYALATAYHETAGTMQPIKEYGGMNYFTRMYDVTGEKPERAKRMGNTAPGDGPRYCGRGYVQLTWKQNYAKAGSKLGVDLVGDPDLAMDAEIAAKILRHGMREGWFTGKSFQSFLPAQGLANHEAFGAARRIINGTDKAARIADYAMQFQTALQAGGWEW